MAHGTAMNFVFQYFISEKLHCGIHKLRDGFKLHNSHRVGFPGSTNLSCGSSALSKSSIQ